MCGKLHETCAQISRIVQLVRELVEICTKLARKIRIVFEFFENLGVEQKMQKFLTPRSDAIWRPSIGGVGRAQNEKRPLEASYEWCLGSKVSSKKWEC